MRLIWPAVLLVPCSFLHAADVLKSSALKASASKASTPKATASKQAAPKETVKEQFAKRAARLWSLQPVTRPALPVGTTTSTNPIDAVSHHGRLQSEGSVTRWKS